MKRSFTKYPNSYVQASDTSNKVLKIQRSNGRVDSYEFRYNSTEGDVFEPKTNSGEWWTSYIVTPDNRLLSWGLNGRYTPVNAVYGTDFWVEDI